MNKSCLIVGWLLLALVAFATLSPIDDRPQLMAPHLEHFAAYFVMGLVFSFAYPSRIGLVLLLVLGSAVTLEALQLLTIDRHGQLADAVMKMAGGICGVGLSQLVRLFIPARVRDLPVSQ
jgi:VanZ family protein